MPDHEAIVPPLPLRLDVRRGMGKEGETVKTVRVATFYDSPQGKHLGTVCGRIAKNLPTDPEAEGPAWAQSLLAWADKYGNLHHPGRDTAVPKEPIGILMYRLIDPVRQQVWETTRADIELYGRRESTPNGDRFLLAMKYMYLCPYYEEPPETGNSVIIQDIDFAENAKGLIPIPELRGRVMMLDYFFPVVEIADKQGAMEI